MTSLHISSEQTGAEDILCVLASASCDVNARNKLGRTALHLAAKLGNLQNLKTLLDAGSDRNIKDKLGFTAVGLAFKFNQKGSADILLHYKPRRSQSLSRETSSEETLYEGDTTQTNPIRGQHNNGNFMDTKPSIHSRKVCDKTLLKLIDSTESRKTSLKMCHLILAILTQKRNILDGLANCDSRKKLESVEGKLPHLIFTSLIQYPIATYTITKLNDKPGKQCLCDLYLKPSEFERNNLLAWNSGSRFLVKLLLDLKDSLPFSRDQSSLIPKQQQSLPPPLNWKLKEKESTAEDLKADVEVLATVSHSGNTNTSISELEKMYDKITLATLCENATSPERGEEKLTEIDTEALKKGLKKLNELLNSLGDSENIKNNLGKVASSFEEDSIEVYLSCLDDVITMETSPASLAEDTLEIFCQNSEFFVHCLKKRRVFFGALLKNIISEDGSWDADKIAKIFLHVCVALVSDQWLLLSCAGAVLKLGLCHQHSSAVALGTCILVRMGLLKQEGDVDIVTDLTGPLLALEHLCTEAYFPRDLAAIFASFLSKSSPKLFGMDRLRLRTLASAVTKEVLPTSAREAESDTGLGRSFKRICDVVALEGDWETLLTCMEALFTRAFVKLRCNIWRIGESILIYLGLLKSEVHVETVRNLSSALKLLHYAMKQSYCPPLLKQLLACFLRKPNPVLTAYSTEVEEILHIVQ